MISRIVAPDIGFLTKSPIPIPRRTDGSPGWRGHFRLADKVTRLPLTMQLVRLSPLGQFNSQAQQSPSPGIIELVINAQELLTAFPLAR